MFWNWEEQFCPMPDIWEPSHKQKVSRWSRKRQPVLTLKQSLHWMTVALTKKDFLHCFVHIVQSRWMHTLFLMKFKTYFIVLRVTSKKSNGKKRLAHFSWREVGEPKLGERGLTRMADPKKPAQQECPKKPEDKTRQIGSWRQVMQIANFF